MENRYPAKYSNVTAWGQSALRWIWRAVVGIVGLVALLILVGAGWQYFASVSDRRAVPPLGELVDVGGYNLHIVCMGAGSPTVILDALGDGTSAQWGWVQPTVALTTRVCAYDRAGRGWSDASLLPRDGGTLAQELHVLLEKAQIDGPKVLVGHSFGGMIVRIYADLYPEDLAGVVLVDAGLPGLRTARMPAAVLARNAAEVDFMRVAPWLARVGLFRLIGGASTLPEPQRSYARADYASVALWDSLLQEAQALPMTDAQLDAIGIVDGAWGDRPLLILAATRGWLDANAPTDEARQIYNGMQQELLSLSSNHAYHEVDGASHASLVMNQIDAAQVAVGIVEVVEAVRTGKQLTP